MSQQLLHRVHQLDRRLLHIHHLVLQMVDRVDTFTRLIKVPSGGYFAARHYSQIRLGAILDREESEMLLIVVLNGASDGRGVEIKRGKFLQIPYNFSQLSIGRSLDDVLLYLLLLLSHLLIIKSPINFHILNARKRLEPQKQQRTPLHPRTHTSTEKTSDEHTHRQEPARHACSLEIETQSQCAHQLATEESN
jgi:hypothetical protein